MKKLFAAVLGLFVLCFALVLGQELKSGSSGDSRLRYTPLPVPEVTEEAPAETLPPPTVAGIEQATEDTTDPNHIGDADPVAEAISSHGRFPFDRQISSLPQDILSDPNLIRSILRPVSGGEAHNNELQKYDKDQAEVHGNHIYMTAVPTEDGYRSGMVRSCISFQYCDLTLRIHTMKDPGLLPAVWMLPDSGVNFPEVDLYEAPGLSEDLMYGVMHFFRDNQQLREYFYTPMVRPTQEVRLLWTPDELSWFVDGQKMMSLTDSVPQEPMYLILNLAVGGDWPGDPTPETSFPAVFHVEILDFRSENIQIR